MLKEQFYNEFALKGLIEGGKQRPEMCVAATIADACRKDQQRMEGG